MRSSNLFFFPPDDLNLICRFLNSMCSFVSEHTALYPCALERAWVLQPYLSTQGTKLQLYRRNNTTANSLPSLVIANDLHCEIKQIQGFVTRSTNCRDKLGSRINHTDLLSRWENAKLAFAWEHPDTRREVSSAEVPLQALLWRPWVNISNLIDPFILWILSARSSSWYGIFVWQIA